MKRYAFITVALLLASTAAAQPAPAHDERPRLTIADFDTNRTGWMPPPHIGTTLADLLTDRLVTSGRFRIIDRSAIDTDSSVSEARSFRDRARDAGVDLIVVGAVTRFSTEHHQSNFGGFLPIPFAGALFHKTKTESVIGVVLKVIDTRTGEVIATATGEGGGSDSHTSGGGVVAIGKIPVPLGGGGGSSATGVQDRLLDAAIREAISDAASQIVSAARKNDGA